MLFISVELSELLEPVIDNVNLFLLHVNHLLGWQAWLFLSIIAQPIFVPVVHTPIDQLERFGRRRIPVRQADSMRPRGPPWILLPVNNGEARIAEVEATMLVNDVDVRTSGEIECRFAEVRAVFEAEGS